VLRVDRETPYLEIVMGGLMLTIVSVPMSLTIGGMLIGGVKWVISWHRLR
jgi:hypothetical protein